MHAEIVQSFDSPCAHPNGLDWDGETVWLVAGDKEVFRLDPQTAAVRHRFRSPGHAGVMYDGTQAWVVESPPPTIFRIDPESGETLGHLSPPGPVPIGLTWDGQHIWCGEHETGISKLDPGTGEVLAHFDGPGDRTHDLAWDGDRLWFVDTNLRRFYVLDPDSGTILHEFPSPDDIEPHGLAWVDGSLWFTSGVDDADREFIHRLAIVE